MGETSGRDDWTSEEEIRVQRGHIAWLEARHQDDRHGLCPRHGGTADPLLYNPPEVCHKCLCERIAELEAALHVSDALLGDGDRISGAAARKRIAELDLLVETAGEQADVAIDALAKAEARVVVLEVALQQAAIDLAQSGALVISHEGRIEKAEAANAKLTAAIQSMLNSIKAGWTVDARKTGREALPEAEHGSVTAPERSCASCLHGPVCELGLSRDQDICDPGDFNIPEGHLRDVWEPK